MLPKGLSPSKEHAYKLQHGKQRLDCVFETHYLLNHEFANNIVFSIYEVNQLDNTFYPIHLSIACSVGNFSYEDEECLAEKMILWKYGGPSACIFNTYYGFLTHLSAHAYSGEIIEQQFYEIFENGTENLGKVTQYSKEYFATEAITDEGYRWCSYSVNLLGDPETPIFDKRNELPLYDEVFVDDDYDNSTPGWGEDHFDKIQDGVDAVFNNGYVYVFSGTYNENIVIDKTISLFGEDKDTTIIDGGTIGNTITINSNSSVVKNFTIKHNDALPTQDELNGLEAQFHCAACNHV